MLGGDLPLTVTAEPEGVVAKLQGADIALLSSNNPTLHFSLFVTPEIKKVEDLRGRTADISRFGSASDFSIRYIFKSAGLSERDVTIVQIGDNPSRLAALKTNAVQARKAGFVSLVDAYSWDLSFKAAASPPAARFCATIGPSSNSSSKVFWRELPTRRTTRKTACR